MDKNPPRRPTSFVIDDDDMDSDTATESNLSLKSRSFLNRVTDRLRKISDHSAKYAMQDISQTFIHLVNLMSSTLEASVCTVKNYSEFLHSIKNTENDLTLKQMFDISEKLILGQSDEVFSECLKSAGKVLHGNSYLWSMMKQSSVSRMQRFMVNQNPASYTFWQEQLSWFKDSPQYRTLDTIDREPTEFEWNIFPEFLSSSTKSKSS